MKPSEVQAYAAARISAVPALVAFGAPILSSRFTPTEEALAAIAARLRASGVFIGVGLVSMRPDTTKPAIRSVSGWADFDVFIAESPVLAHSPKDTELVEQVMAAVAVRATPSDPVIMFGQTEGGIEENGYVLHVVPCSIPYLIH